MAERIQARRPFYWTGFDGVRVVLGGILLTAAALKAHQLVTDLVSLYLLRGLPLLAAGWYYAQQGIGAPTGTVVLPAMLVILGVQLVSSAVTADLQAVPRQPLSAMPLWEAADRTWEQPAMLT